MPYNVEGEMECWIWTGYMHEGTPFIRLKKGKTTARRYYWKREYGYLSPRTYLLALCGEKRCVRPDHMRPSTRAEVLRRSKPGLITPARADLIRRLKQQGHSQRRIAGFVGCDEASVRRVLNGTHWTQRKEAV